jgi:hypothetical protein
MRLYIILLENNFGIVAVLENISFVNIYWSALVIFIGENNNLIFSNTFI